MRICKQCIQSDTRPQIYFSDDGICGACLWSNEKKTIDWNERKNELQQILQVIKKPLLSLLRVLTRDRKINRVNRLNTLLYNNLFSTSLYGNVRLSRVIRPSLKSF